MIRTFANRATEDIFNGVPSRRARAACPWYLWRAARRKLDLINFASSLIRLSVPPGNRLKALRGDRDGAFSVRINVQYRVRFRWENGDAYEVEVTDYH